MRASSIFYDSIWSVVVGIALFVVSSVAFAYLQFHQTQQLQNAGVPGSLWMMVVFVVTVSRAVWVGSLAGLVLMWLVGPHDDPVGTGGD